MVLVESGCFAKFPPPSPEPDVCEHGGMTLHVRNWFGAASTAIALCCGLTGIAVLNFGCQSASPRRSVARRVDSIPMALESIRSATNPVERRAAYVYLGNPDHYAGDRERMDEVVEILNLEMKEETNPHARAVIVGCLGRLGSEKSWVGIHQAAADQSPTVRRAACEVFADVGSDQAVAKLDSILAGDSSADVRLVAAAALGRVKTRAAAEALLSGLADENIALRHRCRESLRNILGTDHAEDVAQWREEVKTASFATTSRSGVLGVFSKD